MPIQLQLPFVHDYSGGMLNTPDNPEIINYPADNKYVDAGNVMNDASNFGLFSHANAAPINNTELEKGMILGNRYSADGLEFEGGLPRGQNTDDILYNMDKIIANQEFNELPGIHFKDKPIENIFNRRNNPRFGPIDMWKNQGGDETTGFKFPSILNMVTEGLGKFRDKFLPTMSPEKRAEVEAIQGSADQYGWGNLPGTGLRGNIWSGGSGGDKVYVANPFGGNLLHNKNLQSYGGSKTIAEMLQGKEDWAGGQFEKYGDTWTDKDHKGISEALYNYYKSTGALQNWQKAAINEPVVDTTAVDNIIDGSSGATTSGGQPGGTGDVYEQHGWTPPTYHDDSFTSPRDSESAFGGDFSGAGPSRHARGGRVSYFDGGLAGLL